MNKTEKLLREYVDFDDVNGQQPVELLPLTLIDMLDEWGEQCFEAGKQKTKVIHDPDHSFAFIVLSREYLIYEDYLKEIEDES